MHCSRRATWVSTYKSFALWIFIQLGIFTVLQAQQNPIKFEHVSIQQGLSQSTVSCILQDKKGFMWFGTEDGLNRYDGYNFIIYKNEGLDKTSLSDSYILSLYEDKSGVLWIGTYSGGLNKFDRENGRFVHYKHVPGSTDTLSNNMVQSIYEDSKGTLWIGTYDGLNKFDRENERFTQYKHDHANPSSISHNRITVIHEDRRGTLWIGTEGGGLNRYDPEKGKFAHWTHQEGNPDSLSNDVVQTIYEDKSGLLWIGTNTGLNSFDRKREKFTSYTHDPDNSQSLSHNRIGSILEDKTGALWIGTYGGGLNRFDPENGRFARWLHEPGNSKSLNNNQVLSIYEDRTGLIWIGTFGGGVNRFNPEKSQFAYWANEPGNPNSLSHNFALSIFEDRDGTLWIGTDGGGLNRFEREKNAFEHWVNQPGNPHSLSNNRVRAIHEDRFGMLWVGTYDGLNRFDKTTGTFTRFKHDPSNPNSISHDYVRAIYEDRFGMLWVGTFGGVNKYNPQTEKFTSYIHDPENPASLSHDRVVSICEDRGEGTLWFGTGNGLNRFDRETQQFTHWVNEPGNSHSLSNNRVQSIYEDRNNTLWIGTYGGGLNRFDRKEERFINFNEKDGLPNDVVYGILEDDEGNLWLSTNKGISRFNPQDETFRNYDINDGLQSDEFNSGAYHKNKYGEMFFGGINGFNAFFPGNVKANLHIPSVVITNFQIFNKSVPIGKRPDGRTILSKSITETKKISLSHKDRVLSFEFAALHFVSPEKNEYAYMLKGFEKEWNYVGDRRFASYTNLTPGHYVFRVKGTNNDGVWNEEGVSIGITITPPFWKTLWFQGVAAIGFLLILYAAYQVRTRAIRERAKELEKNIKERTSELQLEVKERKRKEREAKRRAMHAGLIYDIGKRITSKLKLKELFNETVNAVCETFNYHSVSLFLADEKSRQVSLQSTAGNMVNDGLPGSKLTFGVGMTGNAASTGEIQISNDVRKNPHYVRLGKEKTRSELAAPIKKENKLIGVFDIQSDRFNAFDESDVKTIETLSTQIAVAFENARLFEQAQKEIRERKKAQKKLKQLAEELASSNKELEHFAYIASHDLQEPLRMVASYVQLLARRYGDKIDGSAHEFMDFAIDGASRMQKMINDLLIYSRVGTRGKPFVAIDCESVLGQALDNLKMAIKESKAKVTHDSLPEVKADETQLVQLFQNLISNSLKFREKKKLHIHVSAEKNCKEWIFSVHDNGIGIDSQHTERIFQIFQRLHNKKEYPGTGIGLAVCKRIVERHKGRIWVESQPGKGATFYFTIPERRKNQ